MVSSQRVEFSLWSNCEHFFTGKLTNSIRSRSKMRCQSQYLLILFNKKSKGCSVNQISMGPIYDYLHKYADGSKRLGLALLCTSVLVVLSTISAVIMLFLENRRKRILRTAAASSSRSQLNMKPEKIKCQDILAFPAQLWLLTLICIAFYSATIPFTSIGKVFFKKKYAWNELSASLQQSLFFLSTVLTSPLFGVLVDRTGYNLTWVIVSILLSAMAHGLFIFTFLCSYIPVLMLGVSLSILYASLWPMVSFIVPAHHLGTAFGL